MGEGVQTSGTVTQPAGRVPTALSRNNRAPGVVTAEDKKADIGRRTIRSGGVRRASLIFTFRPYFFLS